MPQIKSYLMLSSLFLLFLLKKYPNVFINISFNLLLFKSFKFRQSCFKTCSIKQTFSNYKHNFWEETRNNWSHCFHFFLATSTLEQDFLVLSQLFFYFLFSSQLTLFDILLTRNYFSLDVWMWNADEKKN